MLGDVTAADPCLPEQLPAFHGVLATADGLFGSSYGVDTALLSAAPQLQVIFSVSVGVDNSDLAALAEGSIILCHMPGVLT